MKQTVVFSHSSINCLVYFKILIFLGYSRYGWTTSGNCHDPTPRIWRFHQCPSAFATFPSSGHVPREKKEKINSKKRHVEPDDYFHSFDRSIRPAAAHLLVEQSIKMWCLQPSYRPALLVGWCFTCSRLVVSLFIFILKIGKCARILFFVISSKMHGEGASRKK